MPSTTKLKIDWATYEAAKYACKNWHYSRSIPVSPLVKIGAWEDDKFIGVILFSRGSNMTLLKPYGLLQTEGCELTRVSFINHKTPLSRILSISINFLIKKNSKLRLIVSFADQNVGHSGIIYQAGNWIYTGESNVKNEYIDKNGRNWHSRQVSESGFNKQFGKYRKAVRRSECKVLHLLGKHRYLMPLDREMKRIIEPLRKPYPKCAESKDNVASSDQGEESGVNPTSALPSIETIHA
jgi:hypothetical protein